jgi:hypothetical protein
MEHDLVKSLQYEDSVVYSEEGKLSFYLSTKEPREENWKEIEELLRKNRDLHSTRCPLKLCFRPVSLPKVPLPNAEVSLCVVPSD